MTTQVTKTRYTFVTFEAEEDTCSCRKPWETHPAFSWAGPPFSGPLHHPNRIQSKKSIVLERKEV